MSDRARTARMSLDEAARAYADERRRLDALVRRAGELGEQFGRLARALSTHPGRLIVGGTPPDAAGEWEVMPAHPLPSIDDLIALTSQIRAVGETVEGLGERLILMGRPDLVQTPDGFFR